jgi:uncharacterized protein (DUF4415 family)
MTAKNDLRQLSVCSDPDDAAELTAEFFESTDLNKDNKIQTRKRPKAAITKEPVKQRLHAVVLAALRESADGWQIRINETLHASLRSAGQI